MSGENQKAQVIVRKYFGGYAVCVGYCNPDGNLTQEDTQPNRHIEFRPAGMQQDGCDLIEVKRIRKNSQGPK